MLVKIKDEQIVNYYNQFVFTDFPSNETYSTRSITNFINKNVSDMFLYKVNKTIVGWAFLLLDKENKLASLEYLAVLKDFRNKGYGTKILNELKNRYKNYNAIYFDVEAIDGDDIDKKAKRQEFYLKRGIVKTDLETMCWRQHYNYFYMPLKKEIISSDEIFKSRTNIYLLNYTKEKLDANFKRIR